MPSPKISQDLGRQCLSHVTLHWNTALKNEEISLNKIILLKKINNICKFMYQELISWVSIPLLGHTFLMRECKKKKNVFSLNENGNEANTYDIKMTAHSWVHLFFTHQSILFFLLIIFVLPHFSSNEWFDYDKQLFSGNRSTVIILSRICSRVTIKLKIVIPKWWCSWFITEVDPHFTKSTVNRGHHVMNALSRVIISSTVTPMCWCPAHWLTLIQRALNDQAPFWREAGYIQDLQSLLTDSHLDVN